MMYWLCNRNSVLENGAYDDMVSSGNLKMTALRTPDL